MNYQNKLQKIQKEFVLGIKDKFTCMTKFEQVLWEYGLLPKQEELDREMSNEHFSRLIQMAMEHTDTHSDRDPENSEELDNEYAAAFYSVRVCPICHITQSRPLVGSVSDLARKITALNPPRCERCAIDCMKKHLENSPKGENVDLIKPLSKEEKKFFDEYEKEMEDFEV